MASKQCATEQLVSSPGSSNIRTSESESETHNVLVVSRKRSHQDTRRRIIVEKRRRRERRMERVHSPVTININEQDPQNQSNDVVPETTDSGDEHSSSYSDSSSNGENGSPVSERLIEETGAAETVVDLPSVDDDAVLLAGYIDCAKEAIAYLTEVEHLPPDDPVIVGLRQHLRHHQESLVYEDVIENYMQKVKELECNVTSTTPELVSPPGGRVRRRIVSGESNQESNYSHKENQRTGSSSDEDIVDSPVVDSSHLSTQQVAAHVNNVTSR